MNRKVKIFFCADFRLSHTQKANMLHVEHLIEDNGMFYE